MVAKPALAGVFESGFAGYADGVSSSLVFVVGGEVADAGVQSHGVVVVVQGGLAVAVQGSARDGAHIGLSALAGSPSGRRPDRMLAARCASSGRQPASDGPRPAAPIG
ncbi:MAG: hypothetical protein QOJ06_2498 [Pseudonocardiales bacterium]|nr:hypothetical protein [Pseudonocardiales bacterium]